MSPNVKFFEDPEALKIGLEKTRNQILELLRVKDMTISQMSEALSKDQSTIYRHVKKLEEAGFIRVKGEKREHHIPERIYGRTAEVFLMSPESLNSEDPSSIGIRWEEKNLENYIEFLEDIGYKLDKKEKLIDLCEYLQKLDAEINNELATTIEGENEMDYFSLLQIKFLAALIKIENHEDVGESIQDIISDFETPE
ncbi:MAG: ArsR/SmtB family transcription factor [Thermoplasmata archaeon]